MSMTKGFCTAASVVASTKNRDFSGGLYENVSGKKNLNFQSLPCKNVFLIVG